MNYQQQKLSFLLHIFAYTGFLSTLKDIAFFETAFYACDIIQAKIFLQNALNSQLDNFCII